MEAAGGINEIYNFYVGRTLQNAYNTASAAFYSRLSYAYGADYTSQAAINSIVGISQATANAYIQRGTNAALSVGSSWGCTPGALTNQAVATFASDVNATKNSVNAQISSVKANKQTQHNAWVEEQARLAALAQILEAAVALAGGPTGFSQIVVLRSGFLQISLGGYNVLIMDAYVEKGSLLFRLDNTKNDYVLSHMYPSDWDKLGQLTYDYSKSLSSDYMQGRTPSGMAREFRDHFYLNKLIQVISPIGDFLKVAVEVGDVGGTDRTG